MVKSDDKVVDKLANIITRDFYDMLVRQGLKSKFTREDQKMESKLNW